MNDKRKKKIKSHNNTIEKCSLNLFFITRFYDHIDVKIHRNLFQRRAANFHSFYSSSPCRRRRASVNREMGAALIGRNRVADIIATTKTTRTEQHWQHTSGNIVNSESINNDHGADAVRALASSKGI